MYYIDHKRTLTRRDSSLILIQNDTERNVDSYGLTPLFGHSTICTLSDSGDIIGRVNVSVQNQIISMFFESMLNNIVSSWELIESNKTESPTTTDLEKTVSESTVASKKKKTAVKQSKQKKSASKLELYDNSQVENVQQPTAWWSSADERAIIYFRNGNMYEGHISMKCMNGEGRFQWADGTIYLGQFKNNEMCGRGAIQWNNDTWYEGDFVNNLRHGKGLYVDSRQQRSYGGYWDLGTKHGKGIIYYSETLKNSYDGEWEHNKRHGIGTREYCPNSGYTGTWDYYVREGNGLMIWPNRDLYRGQWKNNLMSGYGTYIWNACCSNTMSLPSLCVYRGDWEKGQRHGYGVLYFGSGLESYYKGQFKKNRKHGNGKLVTNNGLMLQDEHLFREDNFSIMNPGDNDCLLIGANGQVQDPFDFEMCNKLNLEYHIRQAIDNIDREQKLRNAIIYTFLENNNAINKEENEHINNCINDNNNYIHSKEMFDFEISSLRKSLMCYESLLRNIYRWYATICNTEEIPFKPILIKLYLWQLYYDCDIYDKGLTLVDINNMLYKNPEWLTKTPHNPFEEIYFWQFLHSLICVASHLYGKKFVPQKKPDTITANAFKMFMEQDVLPGFGKRKGYFANGYGNVVPLKDLYEVFLSLGEKCTIRTFLNAVHRVDHSAEYLNPTPIDFDFASEGKNCYIYENEMLFVSDNPSPLPNFEKPKLKLFNFNNVPSKTIIKIFSIIFPQVIKLEKVLNLNIELTFLEFFEAFIACAEESVRVSEKDIMLLQE